MKTPTRVAIVDDSTLARMKVLQALPPDWEVQVRQAGNGLQALELVREGIDVMFLDLTMPEMDGYHLLQAIRAERLATPFVIVVSADIQPLARDRVAALGARAFVEKPLRTDQLRTILEEQCVL